MTDEEIEKRLQVCIGAIERKISDLIVDFENRTGRQIDEINLKTKSYRLPHETNVIDGAKYTLRDL